jgi:2-(1,2-epoxy-1,2-dihydrophenyl)acetyl-CoA isomerase
MPKSAKSCIDVQRKDGVATITLRRPEKRNALTPEQFDELGARFAEVAANPDDRVLVLTGVGEAFCAGADLSGSASSIAGISHGPVGRAQFVRRACKPALALHRLPKPTIAAVNGVAAGGGCNLAIGCDIVFAAESARFTEVFINRGLTLDYGGAWLLPRLVGLQRAKDIAFRGDAIGAREAERLGLILEVVPDADLSERVTAYAHDLAAKAPIALSQIKGALNRAGNWTFEEALEQEAEAQAVCLGSQDFAEAMKAWIQKRPGEYSGE